MESIADQSILQYSQIQIIWVGLWNRF